MSGSMPFFLLIATIALSVGAFGFTVPFQHRNVASPTRPSVALRMGMFDGIAKAFSNQDFKGQDQRVRASHILIKGQDDDTMIEKTFGVMREMNERIAAEPDSLRQIFAEFARRESQCPSAAQGGDLGLFGPGKMVPEFDEALFPDDSERVPPPGAVVGPVVTDFGCHVILVTEREENSDQVEEKLARND
mmetsp:Transcript_10541/g.16191  ORF Transcript_10541/g.16191 Transcript_10541/m.16191 type:complete len:190 (-) Transcript_10541:302-871(-)|eukprot:CAMPEP_0195300892 /NCGR_PEP_ID=MMETSP0707-20130614/28370_1 /TAXON_ID=33640 /ORGANISM="Asterionellopsis glacialis, Strain CCMP134" /LENGTH=189 /DNA_ID=CAMNT_0040363715 /DNA_START=51 /DNA_END=620 /DNA_ORIENTATION=-